MDDNKNRQPNAQKVKTQKGNRGKFKERTKQAKSDLLVNNDPYIVKKKVLDGHPIPLRWVPIK